MTLVHNTVSHHCHVLLFVKIHVILRLRFGTFSKTVSYSQLGHLKNCWQAYVNITSEISLINSLNLLDQYSLVTLTQIFFFIQVVLIVCKSHAVTNLHE